MDQEILLVTITLNQDNSASFLEAQPFWKKLSPINLNAITKVQSQGALSQWQWMEQTTIPTAARMTFTTTGHLPNVKSTKKR